jgi:hypothetical protein
MQFEYTYNPSKAPGLWYDISNVNGYIYDNTNGRNGVLPWPFQDWGVVLRGTSECPSITCPSGNPNDNSSCVQAYTRSVDDFATQSCSNNNSIALILCPTNLFSDPVRTQNNPPVCAV